MSRGSRGKATRRGQGALHRSLVMAATYDIPDSMRIGLIKKALKDCGQEATEEAVAKQYRYEVGRDLGPMTKARGETLNPGSLPLFEQQESSGSEDQPEDVGEEHS